MSPFVLLAVYCLLILVASLAGGWLPALFRMNHRRLELALSFVSGVMLGIALLHLLPHALIEFGAAQGDHAHVDYEVIDPAVRWLLAGFIVMFLLERFFCFHHHDPLEEAEHDHDASGGDGGSAHQHRHDHELTWTGAALGMTIHTLIAGIALAASVESEHAAGAGLAGFGTFLMIVLHKPFDALTIGTLMVSGGHSAARRHLVNALFSLAVPVGVLLFLLAPTVAGPSPAVLGAALAFAAGAFLCIALSDLLPELQFHQHDRFALTLALAAGLALAWAVGLFEQHAH